MSTSANRLLVTVAAATAATGVLFAQPALEPASIDPEARLLARMAELQVESGPTPAALADPLRALAVLYQENDDHALAIAALEEARYVTRVHKGLSSADEALLLRQQIRSEKALGLDERVWDLEQDMVTIARQNHDDIRMVRVFRELAEDRKDALEEYRAGGLPPEIELGCYYVLGRRRYDDTRGELPARPVTDSSTSCRSGQRMHVLRQLQADIMMYYADAIEVILKNGDYASQELRDLEKAAFRIATFPGFFPVRARVGPPVASSTPVGMLRCSGQLDELLESEILGSCLAPIVHANELVTANVGGGAGLIRLLAYEIRSGASAAARANALIDLADWYLFSTSVNRRHRSENSERAVSLYERAYRELQRDDEARKAILSPEVPVTFEQPPPRRAGLPVEAYTPAPDLFASTATAETQRYIDVSFDITKYGRAERIEILDTSRDATRAEERDLKRLIEGTSFRPRVVDGGIAASAPVVVRYALDR